MDKWVHIKKNHPENIIELLLSLEITNGENINEHYLDLFAIL